MVGPNTEGIFMLTDYNHLVSVSERDGTYFIRIDRVIEGRVDLYTEIDLSRFPLDDQWNCFDKIAETLGKALCIDSPLIRDALKI
jgi:hypothetical protein